MEERKYEIYEILAAAIAWLQDPTNEEEKAKFDEIKNNLIIREYMPLAQKEICIKKALIDVRTDEEEVLPHTASILYEIALFFDCLLAYVVNINPDINTIFKDSSNYDVLVLSGLRDHILSFCEKDYRTIEKIADRMISFDNLKELTRNIQSVSPEHIDELTREFERFTNKTDIETLKAMGNIASINDPLLKTIKDGIEDAAYQTVKQMEKEQAEQNEANKQ